MRRFALSLSLLTITLSRTASAEVAGLHLTWRAPAGCPTASEVERKVDMLLVGHAPWTGSILKAEVLVTQLPGGAFEALLASEWAGSRATRKLQGESCVAVASATSVALALALVPEASSARAREAPGATARTPPSQSRARRAPTVRQRPARSFAVGRLSAGVALRALPRPAALFGAGAGWHQSPYAVELGFTLASPQSLRLNFPDQASAEFGLWSLDALACYAPLHNAAIEFFACGGPVLERWSAETLGISNPGKAGLSLISVETAIRSQVRLTPSISVGLGVQPVVRLRQHRFVVGGLGEIHPIPAISTAFMGSFSLQL